MSLARYGRPFSSTSRRPRRHGVPRKYFVWKSGPNSSAGATSASPRLPPAAPSPSLNRRLRVSRSPASSTTCAISSCSFGCSSGVYGSTSSSVTISFVAVMISAAAIEMRQSPRQGPSSCVWSGSESIAYTTTNATARSEARKSSAIATVSAPGFGGCLGRIRRASLLGFRRPRPSNSTRPETSRSRALLTRQPLPDDDAEEHERLRCDEPGHKPLGDRADVPERPPAAVVGVLRVVDVRDDRVQLRVADRLLRERRHHVRPDSHRLSDLHR